MPRTFKRPFSRQFTLVLAILTVSSFAGTFVQAATGPKTVSITTGSGKYVCTPAGFGSKSKCYRR